MTFSNPLFALSCVVVMSVSCKKTPSGDESAPLRALVDRYAPASDAEREKIFADLSALPCAGDALCSAKVVCEKSMLSYRSGTLSKTLAAGLVATAHDDASRALALSKLEEAATQFLDAKNGFEDCVRGTSMLRPR